MNAHKPFKRLSTNINKTAFKNFKATLAQDVAARKVNAHLTIANAM